jgi:4-carboxymuconolactone decarboxylase
MRTRPIQGSRKDAMSTEEIASGGTNTSPVRAILKFDLEPSHAKLYASELARPLRELILAPLTSLWNRTDELPLKVKCLVNVATLAALGRVELKPHVQAALRNGNSPEELIALFMHTALYGGVPLAVDGVRILLDVLEDEDASNGDTPQG